MSGGVLAGSPGVGCVGGICVGGAGSSGSCDGMMASIMS